MKLVTVDIGGADRVGAMLGDGILDLAAAAPILGAPAPAGGILDILRDGDPAIARRSRTRASSFPSA